MSANIQPIESIYLPVTADMTIPSTTGSGAIFEAVSSEAGIVTLPTVVADDHFVLQGTRWTLINAIEVSGGKPLTVQSDEANPIYGGAFIDMGTSVTIPSGSHATFIKRGNSPSWMFVPA